MTCQTKETEMQDPIFQVKQVSNNLDIDLFLFSCYINNANVDMLIEMIKDIEYRRNRMGLILTTWGGDPDPAFRLVRFIKRNYEQFNLYVFGFCKSSGTLVALGANKIIMSDFGELGPLDIQTYKDEDVRRESVLAAQQSIKSITKQVSVMFKGCLQEILSIDPGTTGFVSLKTAESIAASIVTSLFKPIAGKLDPIRMGELERAMQIADDYGSRLNSEMKKQGYLDKLITGYPSHEFVIDYEEAKELFGCVTTPNQLERTLEKHLLEANFPIRSEDGLIYCLSDPMEPILPPENLEYYMHTTYPSENSSEDNNTELISLSDDSDNHVENGYPLDVAYESSYNEVTEQEPA